MCSVFPSQSFLTAPDFSTTGHSLWGCPRVAAGVRAAWKSRWGTVHRRAFSNAGEIPQWPGEAAASLELHGLSAPCTPVRKGVMMVSGITSLLFTLVSPCRRDVSLRQNLSVFTWPDVPNGACSGWCPLGEAAQSSHLPCFSLEQLRQTDINCSPPLPHWNPKSSTPR